MIIRWGSLITGTSSSSDPFLKWTWKLGLLVPAFLLLLSRLGSLSSLQRKEEEQCPFIGSLPAVETATVGVPGSKRQEKIKSRGDTGSNAKYFSYKTPDTLLQENLPISFQQEWLDDFGVAAPRDDGANNLTLPIPPKELPVPDFVDVLELNKQLQHSSRQEGIEEVSLQALGQEARQWIDELLPQGSGAMLFRNFNKYIQNASDFATFWSHVVQYNNFTNNEDDGWVPMHDHLSCYNRKRQRLASGQAVHQVDTDVPSYTIGPHNEHSCNPFPSHKIFFYVLHSAADGGESLLRRNQDIYVPSKAWEWLLQKSNGIIFERTYPPEAVLRQRRNRHNQKDDEHKQEHGDDYHPTEMSWQERCQTQREEEARQYFVNIHGISNVTFHRHQDDNNHNTNSSYMDANDTANQYLTATNVLPGYLKPKHPTHDDDDDDDDDSNEKDPTNNKNNNDELLWYNRIDYGFPVTMTNGQLFPLDLQAYLKRQKWHETYAIKLQPGDWLVLDNRRVQHGRLPYQDSSTAAARKLLVTYTSTTTTTTTSTTTTSRSS